MTVQPDVMVSGTPRLVRSLPLTHAVLYGLGVTIGAGIYVLVGIAAGRSEMHAPLAFVGAAVVMAFSAAWFAELGTRMPVSANEAAYVQAAFRLDRLSLVVGLLVVAAAVVSAGTISVGSAGYVAVFMHVPAPWIISGVTLTMGIGSISHFRRDHDAHRGGRPGPDHCCRARP
jgi:basic amino acid/polyamine antiporter, APA family